MLHDVAFMLACTVCRCRMLASTPQLIHSAASLERAPAKLLPAQHAPCLTIKAHWNCPVDCCLCHFMHCPARTVGAVAPAVGVHGGCPLLCSRLCSNNVLADVVLQAWSMKACQACV